MMSKICTTCKKLKSLEHFGKQKRSSDGISKSCKSCKNAYQQQYMNLNPLSKRKLYVKTRYNLEWDDYVTMFDNQGGCCYICYASLNLVTTGTNSKLNTAHVDHCHVTNKVRGLLCNECNKGLGAFKDSVVYLQKAIQYLERSK
jgi:hypothetical protein